MERKSNTSSIEKTKGLTQLALFSAIIIIMATVPFLGSIPLGFMAATVVHVPVIVGSLILGPKKGAFLGGVFGMMSLIISTINPTPGSFVFTPFYTLGEIGGGWQSLIVCFVPRILVGITPFYVYRAVEKRAKTEKRPSMVGLGLAGVAGSMTNTILVMGLVYVFFSDRYAQLIGVVADAVLKAILSVVVINGIPEAIVAAIIASLVGRVLMNSKVMKNIGV